MRIVAEVVVNCFFGNVFNNLWRRKIRFAKAQADNIMPLALSSRFFRAIAMVCDSEILLALLDSLPIE